MTASADKVQTARQPVVTYRILDQAGPGFVRVACKKGRKTEYLFMNENDPAILDQIPEFIRSHQVIQSDLVLAPVKESRPVRERFYPRTLKRYLQPLGSGDVFEWGEDDIPADVTRGACWN